MTALLIIVVVWLGVMVFVLSLGRAAARTPPEAPRADDA